MRCPTALILLPFMLSKTASFLFEHVPRRAGSLPVFLSSNPKTSFLDSLDHLETLNEASNERTELLNSLINQKIDVELQELLSNSSTSDMALSSRNPGSLVSMTAIGPGTWKVVYAPHMSMIAKLAGNVLLDVQYILHDDLSIESHAKFSRLPFLSPTTVLYLSVSGTYDSQSDHICSIKWTDAWVKTIQQIHEQDVPYAQIDNVPDSILKTAITNVGRMLFIQPLSVFPVSYLAPDLTVFDFDLLGTRICARRVSQAKVDEYSKSMVAERTLCSE